MSGPEVTGRACLHSNAMGYHFMRAFILTGQFGRSFWYVVHTQQALYVGKTSKFSLEQRHDVISSKLRRCSNVICPLGINNTFVDQIACANIEQKVKSRYYTPWNNA